MKLYTIQHIKVWETLERHHKYVTDEAFICEENFKQCYEWLNQQAKEKISGWNASRPVWCWVKKPDLRSYRFIFDADKPSQEEYVLLTLEVPDELILLSHFGLWHSVLNGFPVARNEDEDTYWENRLETYELNNLPHDLQSDMKKSWENILLLPGEEFAHWSEEYAGDKQDLQAIIPYIQKNMVKDCKKFKMVNKAKTKKK